MGIFRKNKLNQNNYESTISTNSTIAEIMRFFGTDEITNIDSSSLNAATYYACMLIRCNAIAKLPLKVMRSYDSGAKVIKDHNLYDLLKLRPNPFMSAHDFIWATEFQRLEYGNAYWIKDFSSGKIKGLYIIDSTKMRILVDNIGLLGKNSVYYLYDDPKQGEILYRSEEICHFKNFAINGIEGNSVKKYIRTIINQEKFSQNVINGRYKNGLQDPLVVTYAGDLDEARSNKIKKKFESMGGVKNAGKVVPIPSDFKIDQLTTKLVDNQFFELNGLNARNIANAFGVKSFQLNDLSKSTYANIEQQNRAFYSDTLQNPLTQYEQEIDYKLLTRDDRGNGIYVRFNIDAMLRSEIDKRYSAYQTGIASGFLKISEAREKENLPFEEGTDRLIIGNGASIPLDQLGSQYAKGGDEN